MICYKNVIDVASLYFITFVEDSSQKVWMYFVKIKDKVFQHLQKFHVRVEREKEKHLENQNWFLKIDFN